jgi:hypothetical protein
MPHVLPFAQRPIHACAVLLIAGASFTTPDLHALPPTASACLPPQAEEQLLRRETALLGKNHAAEHAGARAQQCEVERGTRPVPAKDVVSSPETTLQEDAAVMQAATDAATGAPTAAKSSAQKAAADTASREGRWSSPFVIPVVGVTSVLLNTGKVLFWSYDPASWRIPNGPNDGVAYIWNPSTRQGYSIAPPENIWCAGQTILADGRVFIAGGNLRYDDPSVTDGTGGFAGTLTTYTFNPATELFTRQPDMVHGRWYPTTTKLADNRVVITSGYDETGTEAYNNSVEVFTASPAIDGVGTISVVGTHEQHGFYPLQYLLASGRMLGTDTGGGWTGSYQLDPATWNWSLLGNMLGVHYGMANGISYTDASVTPARQVVMVAGGGGEGAGVRSGNEWLDGANPLSGWRDYPKWVQPRRNANMVILPDGTLLTVGGNQSLSNYDVALLQTELYSRPATDTTGVWKAVAPHSIQAAYHSTAILLPDATVLLSQDDMVPGEATQHKAQVYSPPYLFKGARPQITSAPDKLGYQSPSASTFTVTVNGSGVNSAVLIAPAATTHGNDMHQRGVKLSVTARNNQLTVSLPASAVLVPPGYYMLFVLDKAGIPSVAKFVQVS